MSTSVFKIYNPNRDKKYGVDEALDIIGKDNPQMFRINIYEQTHSFILGRGSFHSFVFLSCGFCLMYVIAETLGVSYIIPTARCDLELDTMRKGILSSVSFLGIAMSSHVSGFLTDQLGRKKTVFVSVTLATTFSAISALAPGFWVIVFFRLLSGIR